MGEIADQLIEDMIWREPFDKYGEYQGELEEERRKRKKDYENYQKAQELNKGVIKW